MTGFESFFQQATGFTPFPYQVAWATGQQLPALASVPTGLGKTAGAVLSWLWRRRFAGEEMRRATPRRLVYCLPMRVLVEQTRDNAVAWLKNLGIYAGEAPASHPPERVSVHVLMGGDLEVDWDHWPERDQILIGTQDMLLSRALNRGYAMSRFRWPVHFGLLNNDCMWAMDEVQLMGSGLATTTQLQAFRRKLGTLAGVCSVWMSATVNPRWLESVDFDLGLDAPTSLEITAADREVARQRLQAVKALGHAEFTASKNGREEAELARQRHSPGTRTLVVVNTVRRAQDIFSALCMGKTPATCVLLHSRFRRAERDAHLATLLADPGEHGTIAVCTQVVEAGVDVSARLLITDLAPWSSMVQRFGRCNRTGEYNDRGGGAVLWIPPADPGDPGKSAPYTAGELQVAAARLTGLAWAGPAYLPDVEEPMTFAHVLRRKDLVELFDTTPDLAGADIDVSRFIREADEHHVQVFWRDVDGKAPPPDTEPGPTRDELCSAPLLDLKGRTAWRWDHLEKRWERAARAFPGLVLMLPASEGGYDPALGWCEKEKTPVAVLKQAAVTPDHNDRDAWSEHRAWETIAEHTDAVVRSLRRLLAELALDETALAGDLLQAARWHDAGKAHAVFQQAMPVDRPGGLWAKSAGSMKRYERPGFRHELASALAMLRHGLPDLAAYLAAAHHGKVRLSLRSLPHEKPPQDDPGARFARGIQEGDPLPGLDLGGGVTAPPVALTLSYMELGEDDLTGPSWLARMLSLRDAPNLGPLRLALLESLLRVADWRASGGEEPAP